MKKIIILLSAVIVCAACSWRNDSTPQPTQYTMTKEELQSKYLEDNDILPGYHVYTSEEYGYCMSVPDELEVKKDNKSGAEKIYMPPYGEIMIKKINDSLYIPDDAGDIEDMLLASYFKDIISGEYVVTDFEKITEGSLDIGYRCMLNFSAEKSIYLQEIKLSEGERICAAASINTAVQTMEQKLVGIVNSIETAAY